MQKLALEGLQALAAVRISGPSAGSGLTSGQRSQTVPSYELLRTVEALQQPSMPTIRSGTATPDESGLE